MTPWFKNPYSLASIYIPFFSSGLDFIAVISTHHEQPSKGKRVRQAEKALQ